MVTTELREMLRGRKIPTEDKAGQRRLRGLQMRVTESFTVLQDPLFVPRIDTLPSFYPPRYFWMSSL